MTASQKKVVQYLSEAQASELALVRVLHKYKRQEPRLVVGDWEHAVKEGSAVLRAGLHATPSGDAYRSAMIADAVNAGCPARDSG